MKFTALFLTALVVCLVEAAPKGADLEVGRLFRRGICLQTYAESDNKFCCILIQMILETFWSRP
jgi:hypothetical protein